MVMIVFPACAGMFHRVRPGRCPGRRFPRVRGDVPPWGDPPRGSAAFSPRARGCSDKSGVMHFFEFVFPACAGMFRSGLKYSTTRKRFPRVRGDVPVTVMLLVGIKGFSPRARGCSDLTKFGSQRLSVFPACAGMFRSSKCDPEHHSCFPRVRGDVPSLLIDSKEFLWFSPRARGCSLSSDRLGWSVVVFPACAGMFLVEAFGDEGVVSFPRVRGDVPPHPAIVWADALFSPRARGCSGM